MSDPKGDPFPKGDPSTYPIGVHPDLDPTPDLDLTGVHPDLDPAKPEILVELDRLVDRMIRLVPDRREAILRAARRLERAAVSTGRETTGNEGNKTKGENSDVRILQILSDLGAKNEEGRKSNIGLHSPEAAREVHEEMTRRWEATGRRRPAPLSRKHIDAKLSALRKEFPDPKLP